MLIKPHVISTPAEGEAISRRLLEELSAHPARDGRPSLGVYQEREAESGGWIEVVEDGVAPEELSGRE